MDPRPPRAAVVVHPETVDDREALSAVLTGGFRARGWADPVWLETTVEDPGTAMTTAAVRDGVAMVVCCGGDGTVRAVATALAGTGLPLALLPTGTGNLLARNLGIPLDLDRAVAVALTGRDRRVDLGDVDGRPFLVMAGVGFDAAMVTDARPTLKSRLGWPAYVLSAAAHLRDRRMRVHLRADHGPWQSHLARSVIVGNVGRLQGGLTLLPSADPADGLLDVAVLTPRGLWAWARVAVRVLTRGADGGGLARFQVRRLELRTDRPQPHELDGDPQGRAAALTFRVQPAALTVRVP